jgi:hypothetical protein
MHLSGIPESRRYEMRGGVILEFYGVRGFGIAPCVNYDATRGGFGDGFAGSKERKNRNSGIPRVFSLSSSRNVKFLTLSERLGIPGFRLHQLQGIPKFLRICLS